MTLYTLNDREPDWRDRLQVGDLISERGAPARVVREVSKHPKHPQLIGWVTLVILRCSWTTRAYTIISRSDLRSREFKPSNARIKLDGLVDEKIAWNCEHSLPPGVHMTCCEVEGMR